MPAPANFFRRSCVARSRREVFRVVMSGSCGWPGWIGGGEGTRLDVASPRGRPDAGAWVAAPDLGDHRKWGSPIARSNSTSMAKGHSEENPSMSGPRGDDGLLRRTGKIRRQPQSRLRCLALAILHRDQRAGQVVPGPVDQIGEDGPASASRSGLPVVSVGLPASNSGRPDHWESGRTRVHSERGRFLDMDLTQKRTKSSSEPIQKSLYLAILRDMSLIMAIWNKACAVAEKRSKSLARRRLMHAHAKVRSITQRLGWAAKPGSVAVRET